MTKFEIYQDSKEEFRFRLKASNGQIVLVSEGNKTKVACENGIVSVRVNSRILITLNLLNLSTYIFISI